MNNLKLTYTALALYALGAAILFGTLVAISYAPPKENGQMLVHFIVGTLGMLFGHILTILNPAAPVPQPAFMPPPPPGKSLDSTQAGFALTRLLAVIAAIALGLAMLGGCTTTTGAMYTGLTAQAEAGIKVFDDNTLATVRTVLCAQPYSAIQRHPELQPGVQALCGPLANVSSLDANQLALLMGLLQSSGVKLQAAPATSSAKP